MSTEIVFDFKNATTNIKPITMQSEIFERLQRIDHFIQIRGTGNAAELAHKLGISRACVYEYLKLMKELGAPIKFCNYRQSYYYDEEGSFITRFLPKISDEVRAFRSTGIIIPAFLMIQNFELTF